MPNAMSGHCTQSACVTVLVLVSLVFFVSDIFAYKVVTHNRRDSNGTLLCNGNPDICDLRFDQVTWPGTHNSMAYDLKFDCVQTYQDCLQTRDICVRQNAECLASYKTQCQATIEMCKLRNPTWLHWMCNGFGNTCQKTNVAVCMAWQSICTDSVKVCGVWENTCQANFPDWLLDCFWMNHPGHDVATQLNDGVRLFDLDTCLVENGTKVILCHGMGVSRALGDDLDVPLGQILKFLTDNPHDIISVEFNDIDGDGQTMGNFIQSKLKEYFITKPGHQMIWQRNNDTEPWPTLRQMIDSDRRIVVWWGPLYRRTPNREPWINDKDFWFYDSYHYTAPDMTAAQLNASYNDWCGSKANETIQDNLNTLGKVLWQTIDETVALQLPTLEDAIKNRTNPGYVCLKDQAESVNYDLLDQVADRCYSAFPYIFRVRLDYYWESNLFEVTKRLNEWNVQRVRGIGRPL